MIELKNVKKSFGDKTVFDDLNLTIRDKEFVVFSGNSGCGKTTILNIIGGIEEIDGGCVLIDGIDISGLKNRMEYYRNKVGFLFQNFALVETKTVRENLEMIYKKSRSEVTIEEALGTVGLADRMNTKVYKLSGGEQQRIAAARLMIKKCSIVLADEPTGSLDSKNSDIIIDLLKKMNRGGKTVVLVTHEERLKTVGDRNIVLEGLGRKADLKP